jgi:hypothetical protein
LAEVIRASGHKQICWLHQDEYRLNLYRNWMSFLLHTWRLFASVGCSQTFFNLSPLYTYRLIFSVTCIGRTLNPFQWAFLYLHADWYFQLLVYWSDAQYIPSRFSVIDIADWLFQSLVLGGCLSCFTYSIRHLHCRLIYDLFGRL